MQNAQRLSMDQPATYQILAQGWVGERWADWFNGMTITREGGDAQPPITILTGRVADQAALRGLLQQLYDLGLPLLQVARQEEQP